MSANETVLIDEDEWVLCNDSGFVYKKKKKRKREEESSTTTSDGGIADLEIQLKKKGLRRRKQTLMKLKDNYKREFVHWSNLSNSLKEIEETNQNQQQLHSQSQPSTITSDYRARETKESCSGGSLIDDLLLQEEMWEGMIGNLSDICDAAEAMCKAEEEHLKQSFLDLPVWASPHGLLSSLSDQDCFSNNKEMVLSS